MRRAFTLVELLVALVISVSIVAAVTGSIFAGFRLWGKMREAGAQDTDTLFAVETLARQLRQSVRFGQKALEGKDSDFSFVTVESGTIMRRCYSFDGMNRQLRTASQPLAALRDDKECDASEPFLSGLESFSVAYLARPRMGENAGWSASWEAGQGLPAALRIEGSRKGRAFSRTVLIPQDPGSEVQP